MQAKLKRLRLPQQKLNASRKAGKLGIGQKMPLKSEPSRA
jgi:hypothetical protein